MDTKCSSRLLWIVVICVWQMGYVCDSQRTDAGVRDYCLDEGFRAECGADAVVVIVSAQYGRMTVGRCVKRNYGYIGCHSDVHDHVARLCSGKRSCRISNFASTFSDYRACPDDLKAYMEVSYQCVQVVTAQKYACESSGGSLSVPEPVGYLASIVTEERGLGSRRCPWLIQARPGQRINVTVIDFSLSSAAQLPGQRGHTSSGPIIPRYCREYAVLRDRSSSRSVVVCNGDAQQKHIYISDSNTYTVEVQTPDGQDIPSRFLLKYEVIGCPLPEAPYNAHIRGTWDTIIIQCNFTNEDWTLKCKNGVWQGEFGNCSTGVPTNSEEIISNTGFLPLGITVVIIIGVALLICISTLIVGLIHLKRRRSHEAAAARREEALLYGTTRPGEIKAEPITQGGGGCADGMAGGAGPLRFATIDRTKTYSPIPAGRGGGRVGAGGEYTHIWEVRRPPQMLLPSGAEDGHHHPSCQAHHHHPQHHQLTLDGRSPVNRPMATCVGTLGKSERPVDGGGCSNPADVTLVRDSKSRASFTTFKPHRDEHIYQSPKLDRKQISPTGNTKDTQVHQQQQQRQQQQPQQQLQHVQQQGPVQPCLHGGPCSAADAPFYFELDPKQGSRLVAHASCSLPRTVAVSGDHHFHNSSC